MKNWDAELSAAANSCYSISAIGLMTAGNSSYADIEKFRSDFLSRRLAGGGAPSQETLRNDDAFFTSRIQGEEFAFVHDWVPFV